MTYPLLHISLSLRNGNAMAHTDFIHPSGKPSAAPGFLNKYLEIREDRVNTHTHTHTGLARQDTVNPLIYKYLAENFHLPQASLPRGNAQAGILHIHQPHHKE